MITLFGYGKTTKAIAEKFGNCKIFDDKFSAFTMDKYNNEFLPPNMFNPQKSILEVTSPGIPPSNELIKKATNLISEYDLFANKMPYSIWVTGTNGKTTTTEMIAHMLDHINLSQGGNIGTPLANMNQNASIWLLETSSFTLHYTNIAKPNLYIILPITPDHISWHGSFDEYEKSKLKPLELLEEGEIVILPKKYKDIKTDGFKIVYENSDDLANYFDINKNNIQFKEPFLTDAMLALAVEKILFDKIDYEKINNFQISKHRVEEFLYKNRIWVNDSKATNPDATIAGLQSYRGKTINLILGGDDKGADLKPLFEKLKEYDVTIYTIGKNEKQLEALSKEYGIAYKICHELKNAVKEMINSDLATINILSPAAASLDQFSSYKQRGELFFKFVKDFS